jgi:hypothetical protein
MYRVLIALAIMVVWLLKPVDAFEIGPPSNCNPYKVTLVPPCGIITDFGEPQHQNITMQALCNQKNNLNTLSNNCPPPSIPRRLHPGGRVGSFTDHGAPLGARREGLPAALRTRAAQAVPCAGSPCRDAPTAIAIASSGTDWLRAGVTGRSPPPG